MKDKSSIGVSEISIEDILGEKYKNKWIWLDLFSWRKRGEIPPVLNEAYSLGRHQRFWKIRAKFVSGYGSWAFEFAKDVAGHDCGRTLPPGHGYYCNVEDFRYYEDVGNYLFKFREGDYRGKTAKVVDSVKKSSILCFGEDVGGYSLDGKYPKGSCIVMEDEDLNKLADKIQEG